MSHLANLHVKLLGFEPTSAAEFHELFPDAPCKEYLPTFPFECDRFSPNVGKQSIHGAGGVVCLRCFLADV